MGVMDGKICMVTGATSGIGFYTALEIAKMGASVIIIGRVEDRCVATVNHIQEESANDSISYLLADLSSQEQIRGITDKFYQQHDHLNVLVNNAGGVFLRRKLSADGIEMTFALNHLAYFLLTLLLLDALKASPNSRVVNVSSGSHLHEHIDFDDLQLSRFYNPMRAYGRSKLANILFTNELVRQVNGTHVTANALTPGMVATDIWKKVNPALTPLLFPFINWMGKTSQEGAQTSIYLATSLELDGITGKYFANQKQVNSGKSTYDVNSAQQLWQISLNLVGLKN
jgi:NAD(P)-dependent dehydrogenase (short-subunit alcohol dehydrogenase family)